MKNLEQIRAANAMAAALKPGANYAGRQGGGGVAKKIPPLIINHGLLQVLAYARSEGGGFNSICDRMSEHLAQIIPELAQVTNASSLLQVLALGDSVLLKRATSEALAWLNYARRFID